MIICQSPSEAHAAIEAARRHLIADLSSHPFLLACRNGHASRASLEVLLVQQGLYSAHFTRYLCALMANLPTNDQVLELASNLFEELGLAPNSPTPHYILYREMLAKFGLSFESSVPTPGTQRLIDTMYAHCRERDPAIGLGALCLGAEGLVPSLYADFVKGFEALGVDANTLRFFHTHMECDDEHAETLARLMAELVMRVPESLKRIVASGEALVNARWAFLDGVARSVDAVVPVPVMVGG